MIRINIIFLVVCTMFGSAKSQTPEEYLVQFDKPFYTGGEIVWFGLLYPDTGRNDEKQEVLHFELISPQNIRIIYGKISLRERLAQGYFGLPTDLEEGYYRFRAFTLKSLREGGYYISADLPVYSEWNENLTVYDENDTLIAAQVDESIGFDKKVYSRRDTAKYSNFHLDPGESWQYIFWVQPGEFENFTPIQCESRRVPEAVDFKSNLVSEDSLYLEAFLSETETGLGVTSPVISVYSSRNKRFYRSSAKEGQMWLKFPDYEGEATLQVYNLNPYQEAVNDLRVSQWTINERYINPRKPPINQAIAEYLIKAKRRRKVYDLFSLAQSHAPVLSPDSSLAVPDKVYKMSDYRYINTLEDFIFEAIPSARVKTKEDGSKTVRLFDTERGKMFMDRPWYIVDGYLTSREEEVLKIPFNDIDEIRLYVRTNTIKKYFEYFLWRNGILEVITRDIKYLRSLKSDPNYVDFAGFIPEMNFLESLNGTGDHNIPDFRTTLFWETGKKEEGKILDISFPLSDDTGRFVYHLLAVSGTGEVIRRKGEFEVR